MVGVTGFPLIEDFGKKIIFAVYFLRGASDWGGSSPARGRTCLAVMQALADLSPGWC